MKTTIPRQKRGGEDKKGKNKGVPHPHYHKVIWISDDKRVNHDTKSLPRNESL